MCIGEPVRVVACEDGFAWCEGEGARERVDMILIGDQPVGAWVLAFHGAARQVLDEREAIAMRAARHALAAVRDGATDVEAYFADLVGREPSLPEHLRGGRP